MANEHAPFERNNRGVDLTPNRLGFEVLRGAHENRIPFSEMSLEDQEQIIIDQLLAAHSQCTMQGIHDERYWNKTSFLLSLLREIRDRKETTGRWGNNYGDED